eukprot:802064-Rhodomonas_salina.7
MKMAGQHWSAHYSDDSVPASAGAGGAGAAGAAGVGAAPLLLTIFLSPSLPLSFLLPPSSSLMCLDALVVLVTPARLLCSIGRQRQCPAQASAMPTASSS